MSFDGRLLLIWIVILTYNLYISVYAFTNTKNNVNRCWIHTVDETQSAEKCERTEKGEYTIQKKSGVVGLAECKTLSGKFKIYTLRDVEPCVFPFVYKGKTHNMCIVDESNTGHTWCSIVPYLEEKKANGKWKYCSGPCVFEFRYYHNRYSSCTSEDLENVRGSKKWCPLTRNYTGLWRFCNKDELVSCGSKPCEETDEYQYGICTVGSETKYCNIQNTLKKWQEWGPFSDCSTGCGVSKQIRFRDCDNPLPTELGSSCEGSFSELKTCDTKSHCPPDLRLLIPILMLVFVIVICIGLHILRWWKMRQYRDSGAVTLFQIFSANLSKILKEEECPEYAALFSLGQARCEASLNNTQGEASCLLQTAKLFLEAEDSLRNIQAVTLEENLECAIMCYSKAQQIYENCKLHTLAANVSLCLADVLKRYQKYSEASTHYLKAIDLLGADPLRSLHVLEQFAYCQLQLRNYVAALDVYIKMQKIISTHGGSRVDGQPYGAYADYLLHSEVNRVLLILLIGAPADKSAKEDNSGYSLDRYTMDMASRQEENQQFDFMEEELFLLLQSLVLAYRSQSIQCIERLCADLQAHLSLEQREILSTLVNELINPSGEAF